ncbi:MAG: VWA domain-containing protein [Planctomycetota bacterium]
MLPDAVAPPILGPEVLSAARLASALLFGLIAWAIPIALRRVATRQPFAPMFLLARVQARADRTRRTRAALVRTLRAIAAAGLTLALWPPTGSRAGFDQTEDAPRVVIDGSASMGWSGDGATPFDEAIRIAELFVAREPETRVLLAADSPRWIQTSDLASAQPGVGRSSLNAALALVRDTPRTMLVTDTRLDPDALIPDHVQVVRVGPAGPLANAAVVALESDGPDLIASVLWTGEIARPITAQLSVPDGPTLKRSVLASPGVTTPVRFESVLAPAGGVFRVRLLDAGDGLAADDHAAAVLPRLGVSLTPLREGATPQEVERRVRVMAAIKAIGVESASDDALLLGGSWDTGEIADLRLGDESQTGLSLVLKEDDWNKPTLVVRLFSALRAARPLCSAVAGQPARVELPPHAIGSLGTSPADASLTPSQTQTGTVLVQPSPGIATAQVLADDTPVAHAAWTPDGTEARLGERVNLRTVSAEDAMREAQSAVPEVIAPRQFPGPMLWALVAAAALGLEPIAKRGAS